jgi:hypothetical protein
MTPEEIKRYLKKERPELQPEPLPTEGKGYSFFLDAKTKGNRIIRVSRDTPDSATRIRLAVSKRIPPGSDEFPFAGSREDLLKYVDQEIELFEKHFDQAR